MKIVSLSWIFARKRSIQANQSLDARVAPLKVQAKEMRDQQQRLRTEAHVQGCGLFQVHPNFSCWMVERLHTYIKWVFPKIGVPPKSSILKGFSIINHPFWGTPIVGSTPI